MKLLDWKRIEFLTLSQFDILHGNAKSMQKKGHLHKKCCINFFQDLQFSVLLPTSPMIFQVFLGTQLKSWNIPNSVESKMNFHYFSENLSSMEWKGMGGNAIWSLIFNFCPFWQVPYCTIPSNLDLYLQIGLLFIWIAYFQKVIDKKRLSKGRVFLQSDGSIFKL